MKEYDYRYFEMILMLSTEATSNTTRNNYINPIVLYHVFPIWNDWKAAGVVPITHSVKDYKFLQIRWG